MPRVNLAGDKYRDKDLGELIRRYKYGKDLTDAQAGKLVGISDKTWRRYMLEPQKMPLRVLRKIQRQLQIPKEEILPFLM